MARKTIKMYKLKTKLIQELENNKKIFYDGLSSNKFIVGPLLIWIRKKLTKNYFEKIILQQNKYNETLLEFCKKIYEDQIKLYKYIQDNKKYINSSFFNEEYFVGGTKSGYIDYKIYKRTAYEYAKILKKTFSPKTVLDAGCAYGYIPKELRKHNIKAYGVDISEFAIRYGNENFLKVADITNSIKFKDKYFDLVICCEVLEHIPEEKIDKALKELIRVTKSWLFITVPTDNETALSDISHISIFPRTYWENKFYSLNLFRHKNIEKYFEDLNFTKKCNMQNHCFVLSINQSKNENF